MTKAGQSADVLPVYCRARVLLLGVGNILFGDDGFGPETVAYLEENYELPADVCALDVGTGVRRLLFALTLSEAVPAEVFILDAVDGGGGDRRFGEVPLAALSGRDDDGFSLHHSPSAHLLRRLRDERGVKVSILACDVGRLPEVVRSGLSPATREAVVAAAQEVAQRLGISRARPGVEASSGAAGSAAALGDR